MFCILLSIIAPAQTPKWAYLKGDKNATRYGVYGTLNTADPANQPGERQNAVTWELDGKLYLFGGSGYTEKGWGTMNDLWEFDHATGNWRWLKGSKEPVSTAVYGTFGVAAPENTPNGRTQASGWAVNGKLYLFGGSNGSSGSYNDLWEYTIATGYWRWIKGSNTTGAKGTYGTQTVAAATNIPGSRLGAMTWAVGTKLYLFGGYGWRAAGSYSEDSLNDLWEYDTSTGNWKWLKGSSSSGTGSCGTYGTMGTAAVGNNPGSRSDGTVWESGGKLYLFGGSGFGAYTSNGCQSGQLNDLWEYNPSTNYWRWLKGSNLLNMSPTYGTKGVAAVANTPGSRRGTYSWKQGSKLYLFGGLGYNTTYGFNNDLWEYDITTNVWRWLSGGNTVGQNGVYGTQQIAAAANTPGARYSGMAWATAGKLYLKGGIGFDAESQGSLTDLWEFDVVSGQWRWMSGSKHATKASVFGVQGVACTENTPGARYGSATWQVNGKMYLFGGSDNTGKYNDLWELDQATGKWRWLKGSKKTDDAGALGTQGIAAPGNVPSARSQSVSWSMGNKLYLFSGDNALNDLWEYDLASGNWRWLKGSSSWSTSMGTYGTQGTATATTTPGKRSNALGWASKGKLYLFGGKGYATSTSQEGYLNDIWEYDPTTGNWRWIKGSNAIYPSGNPYGTGSTVTPSGLFGSQGWELDGKLFMFGGADDNLRMNSSLWLFDLATNNWSVIHDSSQPEYGTKGIATNNTNPGGRWLPATWVSNGRLYLLGGSTYPTDNTYQVKNDAWEFDITTSQWRWLSGEQAIQQNSIAGAQGVASSMFSPGARAGAASWMAGHNLYFFGGSGFAELGGADLQNDLWMAVLPQPPVMASQPQSIKVNEGSNTFFQAEATGTDLAYQWQVNTGNGIFTNIINGPFYSGTTTNRLEISGAGALLNDYTYRLVVSNGFTVASEAATLTLNRAPGALDLSSLTIDENIVANTVVGIFTTTDPDGDNRFTYSLEAGTGGVDNGAFTIIGDQLQIKASPDFETQATYSIVVRTTDPDGLYFQRAFEITVNDMDDTPPTGSVSINNGDAYSKSGDVMLTLTTGDATQMRFTNDQSSWGTWEGVALTKQWTLAAGDGAKTVYMQLKDNAGNISVPFTSNILLDTTPPTVSIRNEVPANNLDSFLLQIVFSEDVNGFTADAVTLAGATKGTFAGSGNSYTLVVTPLDKGVLTANIAAGAATDAAGNSNVAATPFSLTITGLHELEKYATLLISPNPVKQQGKLQMQVSGLKGRHFQVLVVDAKGQQQCQRNYTVTHGEVNEELSLANLAAGIYFLQFTDGTTSSTKKIVIQ